MKDLKWIRCDCGGTNFKYHKDGIFRIEIKCEKCGYIHSISKR